MHDHLNPEDLQSPLTDAAISGGALRFAAQGCQFAISLISNVVLARLLDPADFGLVVMVMTVCGFLQIFREAGLSTATIQRDEITHAQVSNLFWINLLVGGLVTMLMAS